MSRCSNCSEELGIESIGYQKFTYEGKKKDGSNYHLEKLVPFCLVCGSPTRKFDKDKAKKLEE